MPSQRIMKVIQFARAYREDGDDNIFDHYVIILSQGTEIFKAQSQLNFPLHAESEAEQLDCPLIPIPKEDICPPFTDHLTLAPNPLPNDTFLKKPSVLGFSDSGPKPREKLLHEAQMCEILRRHPHPNIVSYLGCVRDEGLVTALCLVRYKETLADRLRDDNRPLNIRSCLEGVKNGLDHLHNLGLNHNDINPANIMLDKEDVPIIIDFDSCEKEGELSLGLGTPGWTDGPLTGMSERKNDDFGLMQLYKTFLKDA